MWRSFYIVSSQRLLPIAGVYIMQCDLVTDRLSLAQGYVDSNTGPYQPFDESEVKSTAGYGMRLAMRSETHRKAVCFYESKGYDKRIL